MTVNYSKTKIGQIEMVTSIFIASMCSCLFVLHVFLFRGSPRRHTKRTYCTYFRARCIISVEQVLPLTSDGIVRTFGVLIGITKNGPCISVHSGIYTIIMYSTIIIVCSWPFTLGRLGLSSRSFTGFSGITVHIQQ